MYKAAFIPADLPKLPAEAADWILIDEAVKKFRMHRVTLLDLCNLGYIAARQSGHAISGWIIYRPSLVAYIEARAAWMALSDRDKELAVAARKYAVFS